MSIDSTSFIVQRNGQTVTLNELTPLAFAGFAHFTAMQVRGGKIRGLDLHLKRLRMASEVMFGVALLDERLCFYLRTALASSPLDVSLTVTLYLPAGEFTVAAAGAEPDVLIRTGPASQGPAGPLALAVVEYERVLPEIKHVGEVGKTHFLRQAVAQGDDDAVFIDRFGRLSEATIWNLAFWDGASVVWPEAKMLGGTTMNIVRRQLARLDIPQRVQEITLADLPSMAGCVVMNSWTPGIAVKRIGSVMIPEAPEFLALLHRAYQAEILSQP
ncbi:branched-chain amino acid aminotransferase [Chania multitudinisentens RB-25]|uniref:Branched-chain amino acid aminotransferase n=1 Tax=Chania multitudinisentens RB-25 TaxID=1441930 RepID=W0L8Z7_9GAMM|nr:aminotransferase class IV family protein [Chania multitudinisentens]AHG18445.1 branched-chain amino acid aminotransferase [Chania multitudinisentens RB-25]